MEDEQKMHRIVIWELGMLDLGIYAHPTKNHHKFNECEYDVVWYNFGWDDKYMLART